MATTTSTLTVSGPALPIQDIKVRVNLTHTYDGDLKISRTAWTTPRSS